MRFTGVIRYAFILTVVVLTWFFLTYNSSLKIKLPIPNLLEVLKEPSPSPKPGYKCGLPKPCSDRHFAFHLKTGAANVIGPRICFEGDVVMSGVKNNIGPGLNIVIVDAVKGKIEKIDSFNMYSGKPEDLLAFLKDIQDGKIILVASFDDSATKMTDEIRDIFSSMGSSHIKSLQFRDGWLFVGASGTKEKSPFEKLIPNDQKSNIFDGWPEIAELEGCFPKKL